MDEANNTEKYNAYVDASGDNGFKFNKDSSICYSVAVFICKESDEPWNKDVLYNIKKLLGVKPTDEIKYSRVRRHKYSSESHKLISEVRGTLISWISFKRKLDPSKFFTSVIHTFPIEKVPQVVGTNHVGTIYIDRMKMPEEMGVHYLTELETATTIETDNGTVRIGQKVKFEDSKKIKLIQLADFYAGAIRYFFEEYDKRTIKLPCNNCISLRIKSKNKKLNLCKHLIKKRPLSGIELIKPFAKSFYSEKDRGILLRGIYPDPPEYYRQLWFIDCFLGK